MRTDTSEYGLERASEFIQTHEQRFNSEHF